MDCLALSILLVLSVLTVLVAQEEWTQKEIRIIDFNELVDESERDSRPIKARNGTFGHGTNETLAPYPKPLDQRREAILDALWNSDKNAFYELARSPITYDGGLVSQTFEEISRELRKVDRRPLRTERHHPIYPRKS